ncbi:hypothetical protein ACPOLB_01800 [Rubrivivax sp. RP6-9]|uniref:hypothetical protein n=1 Tax=Rubrivivax sp. RP6-9 TaxID=3415750 RepID=UPI003CC60344
MIPSMPSVAAAIAAGCMALVPHTTSAQVELLLFPLQDSNLDARIVQRVPTSCGALALARVDAMPQPRNTRLGAADAYAVGADGSIRRQWPVPADAEPRAATATSLVVATQTGLVSVSAERSVGATTLPPGLRLPRPGSCPDPFLQKHPVGFRCVSVPLLDAATGEALIAYQRPCLPR